MEIKLQLNTQAAVVIAGMLFVIGALIFMWVSSNNEGPPDHWKNEEFECLSYTRVNSNDPLSARWTFPLSDGQINAIEICGSTMRSVRRGEE